MKNSIPTKYAHINVSDFTTEQVTDMLLVKVRSSLWLITDVSGDYMAHAKTKKAAMVTLDKLVLKFAEVVTTTKTVAKKVVKRVAKRLISGNVMKFPFGQKISESMVKGYVKKAWGGVFKLVNADIINGYWGGKVEHVESGELFTVVRMDYVINYIRPPKGSELLDGVRELMVKRGVASA